MDKEGIFMRKVCCVLLAFMLSSLQLTALAEPFATPVRHVNQSSRDEMWAVIISRIAPQLGAKPQEKWSVSRCREVADLFENAGFIITDEVKDELYRKPRDHRWYANEAWMQLIESQFGREWYWSLTDMAFYAQAKNSAGLIADRYLLPDDTTPPLEEMLTLFRQEIARTPSMATDPPEGYHIVARLMDWAGAVRWELCAYPDLGVEFPQPAYAMSYIIEDGAFTVDDYRLLTAAPDDFKK